MAERPTACAEWQADLVGRLMAQLAPEREAALDAHLADCAVCRTEADSLFGVAALALVVEPFPVDSVGGEPPAADLGDRILAQVAAERRARRAVRTSFAVAGVVMVALAAVIATRPNPSPPLRGREVAFVVAPEGVEADAVVAPDGAGSLVELTAAGLDPGTTYALWLTPPGGGYPDRVAAGTFRPDARGAVDERLHSSLPAAEMGRVWVTDPNGDITLDTKA